jgi:hypothetical protein
MKKAVITGDLIQSTKMPNEGREWLFQCIAQALKKWNKDYEMKSEMYRGDSFQCLLNNPVNALRVALLIKTYIRSLHPCEPDNIEKTNSSLQQKETLHTHWIFDARIAIGIAEVEQQGKSLAASGGPAFILSGRLVDELKHTKQAFGMATDDPYRDELETESILLDTIISKTTALQCEVINRKLLNYTEMKIAKELHVQQSAVNQRSSSGSWNAIHAMVKRFETIYGDR